MNEWINRKLRTEKKILERKEKIHCICKREQYLSAALPVQSRVVAPCNQVMWITLQARVVFCILTTGTEIGSKYIKATVSQYKVGIAYELRFDDLSFITSMVLI